MLIPLLCYQMGVPQNKGRICTSISIWQEPSYCSCTADTQEMSVGRILPLSNKYSPLLLIFQPTSTATSLTAFPALSSEFGTTYNYPSIIYGSIRITASRSRDGSESVMVKHMSRLEAEAMAFLCGDILNGKEPIMLVLE